MRHLVDKVLDFVAGWIQPFLAFIVLVSGALLSFDYKRLRLEFPKWPGLFDVLESSWVFWMFIMSALLIFVFSFLLAQREKTLVALKTDLKKQQEEKGEIGNNIIILFDGLLLNLSRKFEVPRGVDFRISLYVHDAQRKRFIPCGRYSPNPTLSSPGRTYYPDNEGCIALGWQKVWHFDNAVPANGKARKEYHFKNYRVPETTQASIRMASCLYAVRRLDDAMSNPVAVLVVESIENTQFTEDDIRGKLEGVADDYARMVHNLKSYIPNPASAAERGL
jgi:hypothetical protein